MQSIETTGKSVDDAKKSAATKLGVGEDQLTVTVLEESKGLFGKSNVRIRAEVSAAPTTAVVEAPAKVEKKRAAKPAAEAPVEAAAVEEEPVEQAPKPARARRAKPKAEEGTSEEVGERESVVAGDREAEQLTQLVGDMIEAAGLDVHIKSAVPGGRYVNIELDGRDVAHLVGKHGEVLNSMQYLVNIIASRRFNDGVRATLDGNNYRRRREDQLSQLATRVADEVKNRGEEAVLDALPAFERRVVHKALSEYEGIQTYSEGEEPNRRVVIAPAD